MKKGTSDELLLVLRLLQNMEARSDLALQMREQCLFDMRSLVDSMLEGEKTIKKAEIVLMNGDILSLKADGMLDIHSAASEYQADENVTKISTEIDTQGATQTLGSIRRVTYLSMAAPNLSADDFKAIVKVSNQNNYHNRISGSLAYSGGYFFQCLEGDPQSIVETLARVKTDERHSGMKVLSDTLVSARKFTRWGMADSNVLLGQQLEQLVNKVVLGEGLQSQLRQSDKVLTLLSESANAQAV